MSGLYSVICHIRGVILRTYLANQLLIFQCNLGVTEKELLIAPKFVERFTTLTVKEGEPVSFSARAVGAPTPRITWQKVSHASHFERNSIELFAHSANFRTEYK